MINIITIVRSIAIGDSPDKVSPIERKPLSDDMPYEPVSVKTAGETIDITVPGNIPYIRHKRASTAIPIIIAGDDSFTFSE